MSISTDTRNLFQAEADLAAADARHRKAARIKHLGAPLTLRAKPLSVQLVGDALWIAQSDAVVLRVDLESGATLQVYKGHTAPVTTIALLEDSGDKDAAPLLISGSWDKTVKIWNTHNKSLLSSTAAHTDFVKCVFPIPELKLLVTSGSDKVVRLWDLTTPRSNSPLKSIGLISAHTRPVQCIAVDVHVQGATLYTADTMGVIKVWDLERVYGETPSCRATEREELVLHRTGVNDMVFAKGQLWTASSDDTALLTNLTPPPTTTDPSPSTTPTRPNPSPSPPLPHHTAVKSLLPLPSPPLSSPLLLTGSGDAIRLYDTSDPRAPSLLSTTDAHSFDVTALRLWLRRRSPPPKAEEGAGAKEGAVEPWIVSASLDQTIRKWKLADLISPPKEVAKEMKKEEESEAPQSLLTAEEEAELAELMGDEE